MASTPNFKCWNSLLDQSETQRSVRSVLFETGIFDRMERFSPIVCGSYPLDIALGGSDLDISCYAENLESYIYFALDNFKESENFYLKIKEIRSRPSVIVRFTHKEQMIEIFTQSIPVEQQHGYLHMVIEWHILQEMGRSFKEDLMALRREGIKTEPAFAHLLRLKGDPYISLLEYGSLKHYI